VPALNALAAKAYDANSTFGDRVHFVHIYVIEPHPMRPDPCPYTGSVSENAYSTGRTQPRTYAEREAYARDTKQFITGKQIQLVDDLTPGRYNNPVWCTYDTCPNCAFLIRQDGTIDTVQPWFNAGEMEQAMRRLLDQR
jgi:hypothetical protein